MRATLEFELPEDDEEFRRCRDGVHYYSVLREMDAWLKYQIKGSDTDADELQRARDQLHSLWMWDE